MRDDLDTAAPDALARFRVDSPAVAPVASSPGVARRRGGVAVIAPLILAFVRAMHDPEVRRRAEDLARAIAAATGTAAPSSPTITAPDECWLTLPETAARVRMNPRTLRRWIRSGRLVVHGAGRSTRVRVADLDAAIGAPRQARQLRAPAESDLSPADRGRLAAARRAKGGAPCQG